MKATPSSLAQRQAERRIKGLSALLREVTLE